MLQYLAHNGLIQNNMKCGNCSNNMALTKRARKKDGNEWHCHRCHLFASIRDKSFFHNSALSVTQTFAIIYMWVEDFRNKNAVKEMNLARSTVLNFYNYCQQQCFKQNKIGGVKRVVELDETCWTKMKHHRGKPKKGSQIWLFGAIERGEDGQAFCVKVKNRKRKTLHKLIAKWILPGRVIISDEWPAYLKMSLYLPQYEHMLIRHKKATGGGFSRMVSLPDGTEFNVNTNKCEGFWSQLKQKIKRIHGTSINLSESYMHEQVFRLNARAKGVSVFRAFVELLQRNYNFNV